MKIYALDRSTVVKNYFDHDFLKGFKEGRNFVFTASRHEYFVVQLAVLADYSLRNAVITTGALKGDDGKEFDNAVTCFNVAGTACDGEKFKKTFRLEKGKTQPIFFGFDLSRAGVAVYKTSVTIDGQKVNITLKVNDELVFGEGADEPEKLARLKWLNSNYARNKAVIGGFETVSTDKKGVNLTGKKVYLTNDGLIENVESFFNESNSAFVDDDQSTLLFYRPMEFVVGGQKIKYNSLRMSSKTHTAVIAAEGRGNGMKVETTGIVRYEGSFKYVVRLTAEKDLVLTNIALNLYFNACGYLMGFGRRGGAYNGETIDLKWSGDRAFDSVFIGDVNCGAKVKFGGSDVPRALDRFSVYPTELPRTSWDNYGKGGITLTGTSDGCLLSAYTDNVVLLKGQTRDYRFEISITPFKRINPSVGFSIRAVSGSPEADSLKRAAEDNLTLFNIAGGSPFNPYINYPFDCVKELEKLNLEAQKKDISLSISYNIRDLSLSARELYAFKALGNEILMYSDNHSSDPNLAASLGNGAVAGSTNGKGKNKELSVLTVPMSRYDNYYLEGIRYISENSGIKAFVLDDPCLGRDTAERLKKAVAKRGSKDGCGALFIKLTDRFNGRNGFACTLNEYAAVLPFTDKFSIDGNFGFDTAAPDAALASMSGILFGNTAESPKTAGICQSLTYCMLPEYGYDRDKNDALRDLYGILDEFVTEKTVFKGYWDTTNPVRSDNKSILCSAYITGENMLAVIYNCSDNTLDFEIGIENKLGFTTVGKKCRMPGISWMQKDSKADFGKMMRLKAKDGFIITVKK